MFGIKLALLKLTILIGKLCGKGSSFPGMLANKINFNFKDVNIDDKKDENVDTTSSRFPKLTAVDNEYANYKIQTYGNSFTLEELVETFEILLLHNLNFIINLR